LLVHCVGIVDVLIHRFEIVSYRGTILWFGHRKTVTVQMTKSDEGLLGAEVFRGCTVELDPDAGRVIFRKKANQKRRRESR